MRRLLPSAALALVLLAPASAHAADPPPGATWREEYFETADGVKLHADILRPEGLAEDAKTPVILTVSPYTNHSGQPGDPDTGGPSRRFYDFMEAGKVFERGYTYVMVDLRGFGGSDGCNDWGGPGEQEDVRAAVEWVASQPWSTGKVGMYGKSYDAWTGLMAIASQPQGLAAVISQEPVVDGYRYLYMNRVRFENSVATPSLFTAIDATPGGPADSPTYQFTGAQTDPTCYLNNISEQQAQDPNAEFWQPRNLLRTTSGKRTPLFMTQGFLEDNTKPDAVFDYFNSLEGPRRAWYGPFDHVRGTDRDAEGVPLMGREGFADEAMRFFDHYVAGKPLAEAPTDKDPAIEVQDNLGRWRAEARWPPADAHDRTSSLTTGTYADDGINNGTGDTTSGRGLWTFSQPLEHTVHIGGEPFAGISVETEAPDANLVTAVYDVSPDNQATLISRGAFLVPESGSYGFELYGNDWVLPAGHRIGVLVTCCNSEWFKHVPTGSTVKVTEATISLPFLRFARTATLDGGPAAKLESYKQDAPFAVSPATVAAGERQFELPPPQEPGGAPKESTPPGVGVGGPGTGGGGRDSGPAPQPQQPAPAGATLAPLRLDFAADRRRLRRALRRGFRVRARCSTTCSLRGRIVRGRRTVARFGPRSVTGRVTFRVRLGRRAARRLRAERRLTLRLRVVAVTADGRRATVTRRLKLRR